MTIKSDRDILVDRIDCYIDEAASQGKIASFSTTASGVALDNPAQLVTVAADASGVAVAGIVMNHVVDIDTTRAFLNTQKDEMDAGGKVNLAKQGWIVTDDIVGTPTAQESAYVGASGSFATDAEMLLLGAIGDFQSIGKFDTIKDENGYARITLDIV